MNVTPVSHLRRLCLLSLLLVGALVPAGVTPTAAQARPQMPTFLWKQYPLRQRPTPTEQLALSRSLSSERVAIGPQGETNPVPRAVVVALSVATMLLVTMFLLVRHPQPIEAGRSRRRSRPGAPTGGMPRVKRPRRAARGGVAERAAEAPVFTEPAAGRSATDAPEQERKRTRERQRPIELELLALVERAGVAQQTEREQVQQEIGRLADELRARPQTEHERERELERQHELGLANDELQPAPRPKQARRASGTSERCEIVLWNGVVKSQLFAAPAGGGQRDSLARSPIFHLRNVEEPSAKAEAALTTLLEQLERCGWKVVGEGPSWYQRRLERSSAADPGTRPPNAGT
jgi:hypothetical protein